MTRYALLVRGINVGGKNKVVMAELRQELTELKLEKVETYINSGNIFFDTNIARNQLVETLKGFLIGGIMKYLGRMCSFTLRTWMWIKSSRK